MIELVRDNCVLLAQQRLEQATVCVKAAGIKYRIFGAEEFADLPLQLLMYRLSSADEPHRRKPVPPFVQRFPGGLNYCRIVTQPKIIIGAHVQDLSPININMRILRPLNYA